MMSKQPKQANGTKVNGQEVAKNGKKNGKPKVTWANASDQIQIALARLEQDTEMGLTVLKAKTEAMEAEAKAVGIVVREAMKRGI